MKITDFEKVAKLKTERDELIRERTAACDPAHVEGYNVVNAIRPDIVCAAWSDNEDTKYLFRALRDAMHKHFTEQIDARSKALRDLDVELDDEF